jgi:hypothetical protein
MKIDGQTLCIFLAFVDALIFVSIAVMETRK